jgi:hypothetical protein
LESTARDFQQSSHARSNASLRGKSDRCAGRGVNRARTDGHIANEKSEARGWERQTAASEPFAKQIPPALQTTLHHRKRATENVCGFVSGVALQITEDQRPSQRFRQSSKFFIQNPADIAPGRSG